MGGVGGCLESWLTLKFSHSYETLKNELTQQCCPYQISLLFFEQFLAHSFLSVFFFLFKVFTALCNYTLHARTPSLAFTHPIITGFDI